MIMIKRKNIFKDKCITFDYVNGLKRRMMILKTKKKNKNKLVKKQDEYTNNS